MTEEEKRGPVGDWASDYDVFDASFVESPYEVWDDLRDRCPVAHTERLGGSWMPTRMEDIRAVAKDVEHFSSREVGVVPPLQPEGEADEYAELPAPPIQVDPPVHTWSRRLILPFFTPAAVAEYESTTRALCRQLMDAIKERGLGEADAAVEYSQQIPVTVIARVIGVSEEKKDVFTNWVRDLLEFAAQDPERSRDARNEIFAYFQEQIEERYRAPKDDAISTLLMAEVEGERVPPEHVLGTCFLLLVAGVDTTWSGIGSSLWHLATHAEDRRRLVSEPELIPTAVEEFLRAYSPVTMAREVTTDHDFQGCPMHEGDKVLLAFPAANRDPEAFEEADKVIIDRQRNRHVAFGVGLHRCAGSNLARMEMRVAIEEWLRAIPEFELDDSKPMLWAGGQVRGPRLLPVIFPVDGGS